MFLFSEDFIHCIWIILTTVPQVLTGLLSHCLPGQRCSFLFYNLQVQFELLIYSWVCDHLEGCGWPTRGHTLTLLLPLSQLSVVSYLKILCANLPALLLTFHLSRVWSSLVYTVTTVMGPYGQLSSCVQNALLHCSHLPPLSLTTSSPSTDPSDWVGRDMIHMWYIWPI